MAKDGVYLHIDGFDQFDRIDFDKSKVRRAMHRIGKWVAGSAQMMIALSPGDPYPKSRTGMLIDSITYGVSRSGFLVKIVPVKTAGMEAFYPAYLHYGVRRGVWVGRLASGEGLGKSNRRGRGQRAEALAARKATGWRIAPRDNYMVEALNDNQPRIEALLGKALQAALQPR